MRTINPPSPIPTIKAVKVCFDIPEEDGGVSGIVLEFDGGKAANPVDATGGEAIVTLSAGMRGVISGGGESMVSA